MATILIVEDDPMLADCYRTWLRAKKHKTQQATDVVTAIEIIDEQLPDVILLDLLLPGASGAQLLHILRSHADLMHVPVVVCSGALPADSPDLASYGVRAVLDKATLTPSRLAAAIAEAL